MRECRKSFNFNDVNLNLDTGIEVRLFEFLGEFVDAQRKLIREMKA